MHAKETICMTRQSLFYEEKKYDQFSSAEIFTQSA